jgi:hypothetical protein
MCAGARQKALLKYFFHVDGFLTESPWVQTLLMCPLPCAAVGKIAFDKFNVTYHGEALPGPMCQLVGATDGVGVPRWRCAPCMHVLW